MKCQDVYSLVPRYLDGELSEVQAAPLRKHLLECLSCRDAASGQRAFKRWFVRETAAAAPEGFAQRVAALAVRQGGDPAQEHSVRPRLLAATASGPSASLHDLRRFVLVLTALAAGLLFVLSLALRTQSLPTTRELSAQDLSGELQGAFQDLERLNAAEREARDGAGVQAPAPALGTDRGAASR